MGQPGRTLLRLVWAMGPLLCACPAPSRTAPTRRLPPEELSGVWHTVQPGQSLRGLALQYRVPLEDIEEINGLDQRDPLQHGRVIFIPGGHPLENAPGSQPASRPTARAGQGLSLIWPVPKGRVSSKFGRRGVRVHEGIDISAQEGTAVLASADGIVIYSGSGVRGYGNLVLLRHRGGLVTVYAHNRKNLVQEGERVQQGQVIAEVGRTGRATANHLHFEIRQGEQPVDPLLLVHP